MSTHLWEIKEKNSLAYINVACICEDMCFVVAAFLVLLMDPIPEYALPSAIVEEDSFRPLVFR